VTECRSISDQKNVTSDPLISLTLYSHSEAGNPRPDLGGDFLKGHWIFIWSCCQIRFGHNWLPLPRCVPTTIFHIPLRITSIDMRNITTFENLCFLEITLCHFGDSAQRTCAILWATIQLWE
jgi:hypothetical protein